jgi:hypothetical protein
MEPRPPRFLVTLDGQLVHCRNIDDAMTLQAASRILLTPQEGDIFPGVMERIAAVAARYGCEESATAIRRAAVRLRVQAILGDGAAQPRAAMKAKFRRR